MRGDNVVRGDDVVRSHADSPPYDLLIIGASVRAATMSAVRAGLRVVAVDLFSDRDLQSSAVETYQVSKYPDEIIDIVASVRESSPDIPWMYTGAIENFPYLVGELERAGRLCGNGARAIREVRNPFILQDTLRRNEISFPTTTRTRPANDATAWLKKAFRSAGGQQVERCFPTTDSTGSADTHYFQEHIPGEVCSAAYLADSTECSLLGISDMLVGQDWLGTDGFDYCGSMTRRPAKTELEQWQQIGSIVSRDFDMLGLFGVDAIVHDGKVFPLEVNPRYTASMELFDHAKQTSIVRQHINACSGANVDLPPSSSSCVAKAILYAPHNCDFPLSIDSLLQQVAEATDNQAQLADVPKAGLIEIGHPVLSVIVTAESPDRSMERLRSAANVVYGQLST